MGDQIWKDKTKARWIEIGLEAHCQLMGISYQDSFLSPLNSWQEIRNPFEGLEFSILPNSIVATGVLHLHPEKTPESGITWEEWFRHDDGVHHHILRNFDFPEGTQSWQGNDADHPATVCNIHWRHFNDVDMRPTGLRQ